MKVLVTGGSGRVGEYVVRELLGRHGVTILDVKPSEAHPGVPRVSADLADLEETRKALKGFDAVVHLAAIANPGFATWDKLIATNTASTHNVLEAMKSNGITRIVYASSESATGFGIHTVEHKPLYLPLDEDHPCWPHECYSLSKYFGEKMCEEYSRAYGIEAVSLRFNCVWFDSDRHAISERLGRGYDRGMSYGGYVHAQDAAQACRLALDYRSQASPQHDVFFISAEENCSGFDCKTILAALYGDDVPPVDTAYFAENPCRSFFSTEKAKNLLGYQPKRSWREWV
jgi:UDP-glucose 4-epimerase